MDKNSRALANRLSGIAALALAAVFAGNAMAAPEEVTGPGVDVGCFAPRDADVKYLEYPAKTDRFASPW